jgi:hypothetical protein
VDGVNEGWEEYDLLTPDRVRVEVKTSAYIQSWTQSKLSTPRFSIRKAYGWNPETNEYTDTSERHSDAYVFCLHHHKDQATIDALDMSQWTFWVLPTERIDTLGDQKTIGIGTIRDLGAIEIPYGEIYQSIQSVVAQ